jgi:DNA-binding NarL/FixJ family response regulator
MIGEGLSTRETAQALHLSVKTIESHRQRIRNKLNLSNGSQLLRFAMAYMHKNASACESSADPYKLVDAAVKTAN